MVIAREFVFGMLLSHIDMLTKIRISSKPTNDWSFGYRFNLSLSIRRTFCLYEKKKMYFQCCNAGFVEKCLTNNSMKGRTNIKSCQRDDLWLQIWYIHSTEAFWFASGIVRLQPWNLHEKGNSSLQSRNTSCVVCLTNRSIKVGKNIRSQHDASWLKIWFTAI